MSEQVKVFKGYRVVGTVTKIVEYEINCVVEATDEEHAKKIVRKNPDQWADGEWDDLESDLESGEACPVCEEMDCECPSPEAAP